ncbi:MAG: YbaK/EbsC family protein [Lactimicrobium massiliense]
MSAESVRTFFEEKGIADRIQTLHESTATVALAAAALHIEEAQIAKTMAFMVEDQPVLVVCEGTARIDNHKFKEAFHTKAKMMSAEQLMEYVGHEPGGVCPFGLKPGVDVYLDESLKHWDKVWPAAGAHNNAICVSLEELEQYSGAKGWVDVTKAAA